MDRYPNKRIRSRSGGRFAKAPSLEAMGYPVAHGEMECICGHRWRPLLATGICPQCGSTEKKGTP